MSDVAPSQRFAVVSVDRLADPGSFPPPNVMASRGLVQDRGTNPVVVLRVPHRSNLSAAPFCASGQLPGDCFLGGWVRSPKSIPLWSACSSSGVYRAYLVFRRSAECPGHWTA